MSYPKLNECAPLSILSHYIPNFHFIFWRTSLQVENPPCWDEPIVLASLFFPSQVYWVISYVLFFLGYFSLRNLTVAKKNTTVLVMLFIVLLTLSRTPFALHCGYWCLSKFRSTRIMVLLKMKILLSFKDIWVIKITYSGFIRAIWSVVRLDERV